MNTPEDGLRSATSVERLISLIDKNKEFVESKKQEAVAR